MSASASGSLTTTGSVTLTKPATDTMATLAVDGTYGTLAFVVEGTIDGTNWSGIAAVRYDTGAVVTGSIAPADNTEQIWKVPSEGLIGVRARVTAIASGAANFVINSRSYVGLPFALSGVTSTVGSVALLDNATLAFGTGTDISMTWDGTKFAVTQAAPNSAIHWGVDGAGIDHTFFGDTASTSVVWDQSADSLIFNGAARLVFTGTTGQPEIHLTDNLADALSIEISGSTDLLTFTTTDNAECVSPIGLRTRQSTAVAITGATALKLSDSGGIFTVAQSSAYDIDLPSPTSGPGCRYFFSLTAPGAFNVTVTVLGGAATFVGSVITEGQIVVATGSTLTFASGVAVLGDSIEIQSIATNLYHVRAVSSILNGITIA